jgi:hypothetical protein
MSYHTTTPKILDTLILSLVFVYKKNTCKISLDLFLTYLAQRKFNRQEFFRSNNSNQVLFLYNHNT